MRLSEPLCLRLLWTEIFSLQIILLSEPLRLRLLWTEIFSLHFFFCSANPYARDFFFFGQSQNLKTMGLTNFVCVLLCFFFVCGQSQQLKTAGLTCYNHNLDTSPEFYPKITSSRTYDDRLDTLGTFFLFLCVWICICV